MKPYGFPKLDTCCKACVKRAGITKEQRKGNTEKGRARQEGKREIEKERTR